MLDNEYELRLFNTDFYFKFCVKCTDEEEAYEQEEIDQALNELVRIGLIEKKSNYYRSLCPGKMIESIEDTNTRE
jgi:hypothetical protein